MEPNTNQPIGTNPIVRPAASQSVGTPPVQPTAPVAPQNLSENPKKGMGKGIILIIILVVLVLGIIAYILFAKAQMNKNQKTTADNNSLVLPSPTRYPTLAPENDLEIVNPETDLSDLDADVTGL